MPDSIWHSQMCPYGVVLVFHQQLSRFLQTQQSCLINHLAYILLELIHYNIIVLPMTLQWPTKSPSFVPGFFENAIKYNCSVWWTGMLMTFSSVSYRCETNARFQDMLTTPGTTDPQFKPHVWNRTITVEDKLETKPCEMTIDFRKQKTPMRHTLIGGTIMYCHASRIFLISSINYF